MLKLKTGEYKEGRKSFMTYIIKTVYKTNRGKKTKLFIYLCVHNIETNHPKKIQPKDKDTQTDCSSVISSHLTMSMSMVA